VDTLLVAIAVSSVTGLAALLVRAWTRDVRRTRRVLRKARVVPIAELVDGQLACVVGRIERDSDLIESLIEGRHCVAFDTTTNVFDGVNFTSPLRIEVTRRVVPFYVVDATGRVRVDTPQIALCNRPIARTDRYEERILEEGATIRIVGSVILTPVASDDGEHSFREQGASNATITGTAKYPLLADTED
jgi:hypothetical protein